MKVTVCCISDSATDYQSQLQFTQKNKILSERGAHYEKKYNTEEHLEYKITNNPEYKIVGISKREKEIIDKVIEKFKNYRSSEISEYMHKENAYIETIPNEIISFEFAKELKSF